MPSIHTRLAGQPLTEREVEILARVASGLDHAAIAADLHLSPHTVKGHLQRAARKLRTTSRAQSVGVAIATRQLPPRRIAIPDGVHINQPTAPIA